MEPEPFVLAQVPSPSGARLHFSWGCGHEIFCCDTSSKPEHESSQSCVQWGWLSAPQRRIAYDTASKFVDLQRARATLTNLTAAASQERWATSLAFSRAVSAILNSSPTGSDSSPEDYQALQERALWDLVSLFSIDSTANDGSGAPDLPKWLRSNALAVAGGPSAAPLPAKLADDLQQAAIPESHPEYWPTLQRLVALGWVADALELLGLHSAWLQWTGDGTEPEDISAQIAVLEAATLLLRRFPTLTGRGAAGGGTAREFDSLEECLAYRRSWVSQCSSLLENTSLWSRCTSVAPDTSSGVEPIVGILAGRPAAIFNAAPTWAELLVSRLLHIHPSLKSLAELRQLLHRCVADREPEDEFQHVLAAALDACCDADTQSVMRACSQHASDWFMAHIPEVLAAHPAGSGLTGEPLKHLGATQVEFYALEYAAALAPHAATWTVAAEYLAWCESYGLHAFRALVHRLPLRSCDSQLALRAAALCKDQGLGMLAAAVQRVQGVACWQNGLVGASLCWFGRAGDVERADAALRPLAQAAWHDNGIDGSAATFSSQPTWAAAAALMESLDAMPFGGAQHALLRVKALLRGGDTLYSDNDNNESNGNRGGTSSSNRSRGLHDAVTLLKQLPRDQRQRCLGLVWGSIPTAEPRSLTEGDVLQLLEWLEGAQVGAGLQCWESERPASDVSVARVSLVRLLAAIHLRGNRNDVL